MECWLYSLLILMIIPIFKIESVCIEEERKALLEIKASLIDSYVSHGNIPLPSWVDRGTGGGECCDWERVNCSTTSGHITYLSLSTLMRMVDEDCTRIWPLNVSLFLNFKELRSLDLSVNCLDNGIVTIGLEKLSNLKKLEMLDLNSNSIENGIFPSLDALTSLKVLNLGHNGLEGYFPAVALENLEILDLTDNRYYGFEHVSTLKKLKSLNFGDNRANETFITSLIALPLLKALDLSGNRLYGSFPAEELANLINLEKLDLRNNSLGGIPSVQDCKRLSTLKKLESIAIGDNDFNKSIISCLSALPSLKSLHFSHSYSLGNSFPIQELSHLRDLKVIVMRGNFFNGALPMEVLTSFHHLEVLDLTENDFSGSIPTTIRELSSLRVLSLAYNKLNGSLLGLCELKNLYELDLNGNMFEGNLPRCFNNLSSLKMLDISYNQFTGKLMPSLIANLTSLEYVDFSKNRFEGSFPFSSFSNLTKLEVVKCICHSNKFEVETEEPIGWIPTFQLKILVLSGCNINRPKGSVVPGFLFHQHKLKVLNLPHNSLVGKFPNWLIENNTMLQALNLRNNSYSGIIRMPQYVNSNTRWLDMSENHLNGVIPGDIKKILPNIAYLKFSSNSLEGAIPSSIGDLDRLQTLDLSDNELSGEVPKGLFTNHSYLRILKVSNNILQGHVLSGNLSFGSIYSLYLDSNSFTGKIGNGINNNKGYLEILDISNNFFTGMIPRWISNMSGPSFQLMARNNSLDGQFPCGTTSFSFLDISQNSFSGPIPFCLNWQYLKHLHLGSNRFTGSIPNAFRNLTDILTLDIGNNFLSGRIPTFLGELSNLRILILRNNNFSGFIPKQLCQLSDVSLIDLSRNYLSGSIPPCLQNITNSVYPTFKNQGTSVPGYSFYNYVGLLNDVVSFTTFYSDMFEIEDEVQFTTKALSLAYKGSILDYMVGLDLSDNELTGEIPKELGLLIEIHTLNLSYNHLSGPIPMQFSNLANIESLDLSSNRLNGEIPSQLIKLTSLAVFNVSHNNLSGRLPETKAQFGTFTKESYEGNSLLCGLPLEKKCTPTSPGTDPSPKEGAKDGSDKWYDIDMTSFYGSSGSTWVVFLLGFVAVLYINPYWRRRWLDFVEECMYACYYFLEDSVRKVTMVFRK